MLLWNITRFLMHVNVTKNGHVEFIKYMLRILICKSVLSSRPDEREREREREGSAWSLIRGEGYCGSINKILEGRKPRVSYAATFVCLSSTSVVDDVLATEQIIKGTPVKVHRYKAQEKNEEVCKHYT